MELIDVLDEHGKPTGKIKTRSEVHRDGDWHRTVHVWIINSKHELLLQRRALKVKFPNMWGMSSVGGHIKAGDTSDNAAKREVQEELGYQGPINLEQLFTVKASKTLNNKTYFENEYTDVFLTMLNLQLNSLSLFRPKKWPKLSGCISLN